MIIGIGNDIIDIRRVEKVLERHGTRFTERIFTDVMARCAPRTLSVEARYTRRGGLDINPWRATPGMPQPAILRDERQ